MFIRDYALPQEISKEVSVSYSLNALIAADRRLDKCDRPSLLVWRGAFRQPKLLAGFTSAAWPTKLLEAFPVEQGWPWVLLWRTETCTDPGEILRRTVAASGIEGTPVGNVHLKLEIRRWEDRATTIGGLEWWLARADEITERNAFGGTVLNSIIKVLRKFRSAQRELFVDQLSIVLTKDAGAASAGIAPILHADNAYGHRESAISSILEQGWDRFGGTMCVPGRRMIDLRPLLPMTAEEIATKLPDTPVVITNSGDLLIYDGMLGEDGQDRPENGIPHMSPDISGFSSRFAILFRSMVQSRDDVSSR